MDEKIVDSVKASAEVKETPIAEKKTYGNYSKRNNYKSIIEKKYKVVLMKENYIVVTDEEGHGIRKNGSFPNAKIGEFITF